MRRIEPSWTGSFRSNMAERARRRPRAPAVLPALLLALLGVVASVIILREGRDTTFYYDEWDFILRERSGVHSLFVPHIGHLSLVPSLIYRILFHTVGLSPYWPYRAVVLAVHLLCVALLFVLVRRRVGDWLALAAATVLLFLGSAWEDLLWPFQIGYLSSLAAGLGAFIALDRRDRKGDIAAAVLLAVSLASSGVGLPILAGAAVEVLWTRDRWSRIWLVLAPLALYGIWWLDFHPSGQALKSNVPDTPHYVGEIGASAFGGITGLGVEWGRIFLFVGAVLLCRRLLGPGSLGPRLAAVATAMLAFWTATGLSRAHLVGPEQSRYIYVGAVFLLIAAAEMAARARPLVPVGWGLLLVALLASVASNVGTLRDAARTLRASDRIVSSELRGLEIAGARAPADFQPDPARVPQITAGLYLPAVRDLGSPAWGVSRIEKMGVGYQAVADGVLVAALGLKLEPVGGAPSGASPPQVDGQPPGPVTDRGNCVTLHPAQPNAALDVTMPAGGVVVRAADQPVSLSLRRLTTTFGPAVFGSVPPRSAAQLRVPRDGLQLPWHLRLTGSGAMSACTLQP